MKAFLDSIDWKSFVYGVIAAFVFGFLSQQLRLTRKAVGNYYKPQSVTLHTKESPAQVASGCSRRVLMFIVVIVIFVVLAYLVFRQAS